MGKLGLIEKLFRKTAILNPNSFIVLSSKVHLSVLCMFVKNGPLIPTCYVQIVNLVWNYFHKVLNSRQVMHNLY